MRMSGHGQSESGGACHDLMKSGSAAGSFGMSWKISMEHTEMIGKSSTNHLQTIYKSSTNGSFHILPYFII